MDKDEISCAEEMEKVKIGLQIATAFFNYHAQAVWMKYTALLVANSIVIGAIGFANETQRSLPLFGWVLPIMGLILSIIWLFMTMRGTEYGKYFIWSIRELEEKYLGKEINILSRGASFGEGKDIEIKSGDTHQHRRMSKAASLVRTVTLSYIVVIIFIAIYGFILFQNIAGK